MRVGIIGAGLLGEKRAKALAGATLVGCADIDTEKAERLAARFQGCAAVGDWRKLLDRKDVEIVVVATPHNTLAEITARAIEAGKHVLVEKPAARHASELEPVLRRLEHSRVLVRVGFNHRYHRSFRQAQKIIESGSLGSLMFLRARYGHGGRIGYEKEWRAQPRISGGGELIDQGVHLIDLARWFLGEFNQVDGYAHTYFWNMPVDDNAFMMLRTAQDKVAFLHASCTEWKNTFSFEIYGQQGKLHIDGLGGSYGIERLTWYKMLPQMGPPETTIWEYAMTDDSWEVEMKEFLEDIRLGRTPAATLQDAAAALWIVDRIYRKSGFDHRP